MTRRDAIIHARALLRHLIQTGAAADVRRAAPGWCAALRTLIRTAETAERGRGIVARQRAGSDAAREAARAAAQARWARLSAEDRAASTAPATAARLAGGGQKTPRIPVVTKKYGRP